MLNNSNYKGQDIMDNSFKNRMLNYFNPYEYNLESNIKDNENMELKKLKTNTHEIRRITKK